MITFKIALQNLLASRKRTLFLGTALFLVTALLVMLQALTAGIEDNLIKTATMISSGHVNVGGFFKTTPGDAQAVITRLPELEAVVRETLPDAVRVVDRSRGWGKLVSDGGTVQSGISGIVPEKEAELLAVLTPAPEKEYRNATDFPERTKGNVSDIGTRRDGIIIFASQAKQLKVDVGDQLTLRTETFTGQSNTVDVTVVAVARDLGPFSSWSSFVHRDVVTELYQWKPDVSGALQVYLKNIDDAEVAMGKLRAAFEKKGLGVIDHESQPFFMKFQTIQGEDWLGQKLDITTWRDESSFLLWVVTGIQTVSFFLLALLTIIIVIGIMNTTYIAVRERTREIGTLRAIGLSRGGVLSLFLIESLLLGLAATTLGAVFGAAVASLLELAELRFDAEALRMVLLSDVLHMKAEPLSLVQAVVTFTFITGISALLPALRASRVPPVVAMQASE
jgi:putative ABC transport system permease protein